MCVYILHVWMSVSDIVTVNAYTVEQFKKIFCILNLIYQNWNLVLHQHRMDDQANTQKVVYGILEFLDEEFKKTTTSADSKESLEVAMQCLETAFGISLRDTQYRSNRGIRDLMRNSSSVAAAGVSGAEGGAAGASPYNPLAGSSVSWQNNVDEKD